MKEDFSQIYAQFDVGESMRYIPSNALKGIINRNLSVEIANFIMEHMEELPIVYTKEVEENPQEHIENHRIRLNLISDYEIRRLREIERLYNTYSLSDLIVKTNNPGE